MTSSMKWGGSKVRAAIRSGGADGIEAGANLVFKESQRTVPTDTDKLKQSGKVTTDGLHAEITYGEGLPDIRAIVVHEKLDLHHDDGTAKYLENPTAAAAARVRSIIAAAIRRKL
jgi:hypothetical protein